MTFNKINFCSFFNFRFCKFFSKLKFLLINIKNFNNFYIIISMMAGYFTRRIFPRFSYILSIKWIKNRNNFIYFISKFFFSFLFFELSFTEVFHQILKLVVNGLLKIFFLLTHLKFLY